MAAADHIRRRGGKENLETAVVGHFFPFFFERQPVAIELCILHSEKCEKMLHKKTTKFVVVFFFFTHGNGGTVTL